MSRATTTVIGGIRQVWIAGAACLTVMVGADAFAQQKRTFDIPAQEASISIELFSRQSGVQVLAPSSDVRGIRTNAVAGDYEPLEAVRRMLEGTGLEVIATGEDSLSIRRVKSVPADTASLSEIMLDEILVTGSRISRAGFDTVLPTLSTSSAEIEQRGYVNVQQALDETPGFGPGSSAIGNQSSIGAGQSYADFFGLGSARTLTLVNGRRYVTSNSASNRSSGAPGVQVDLNTIPVGLIDRIETIAIGGAPTYGSDAIAGTVNIILKDHFNGAEVTARYGLSGESDARNRGVQALFGSDFAGGRGNAVLAVEYNDQQGLLKSARFARFTGPFDNPANTGPDDGIPDQIVVSDSVLAGSAGGGLPIPLLPGLPPIAGLVIPGLLDNGLYLFDSAGRALQFGANGDLVPFAPGRSAVTVPLGGGAFVPFVNDGGEGYRLGEYSPLLAPTERTIVNGNAHFDLNDSLRVFFEGAYARTQSQELAEVVLPESALFSSPLMISASNAFLSPQAREVLAANGIGSNGVFFMARDLQDLYQRRPTLNRLDLVRTVAGLQGGFDAFGERWSWDVSYNFGRSRSFSRNLFINQDNLEAALQAVAGPGGTVTCANGDPGCVPINLFGRNNFSNAAAGYVTELATARSTNEQRVATVNLGGRLPLALFGADNIGFNLGVERRKETAEFDPNEISRGGEAALGRSPNASLPGYEPVSGEFTTKEFYGELVAPLVSRSQELPVVEMVELEASARYVDNSIAGGDTTWSAGLRLAPRLPGLDGGLVLRGVSTHAIRAPAITELFLGGSPVLNRADDPCDATLLQAGNAPSVREANCRAALAALGGDAAMFDSRIGRVGLPGLLSGNEDLQNEVADSWSVGFVLQPTQRLRLAFDWIDVSIEDAILNLDVQTLLQACYDSTNYPNEPACSSFSRIDAAEAAARGAGWSAGDLGSYRQGYVNVATLDFAGLIVAAEYGFEVSDLVASWRDAGMVHVGLKLFHTSQYDLLLAPGIAIEDSAGTVANPDVEAQLNLTYNWRKLDIGWQTLYTSATRTANHETLEQNPFRDIPSHVIFNGTFGLQLTDKIRAQLVVNNVFDKRPPFNAIVTSSSGNSPANSVFDQLGRRFIATVRARF